MKRFWLAALAAGMLTAAPAHALDIRVDPAPLYVFDQANERNTYDLVLQNILVVNNERRARDIRGLRVELRANNELISMGRAGAASIARRAERMSQLSEAGALQMMDFQFHLSRIMHAGERLSADATLDPNEAYLNISFYISANALPDTARVIVEGPRRFRVTNRPSLTARPSTAAGMCSLRAMWRSTTAGSSRQNTRSISPA